MHVVEWLVHGSSVSGSSQVPFLPWSHCDALEHYVYCRVVRALFRHYFGAAHGTFVEFLGLHSDFEAFSRQALGLHAVKSVVETTRLNPSLAARSSAEARFRAALLESVRKSPGTTKRLRTLAVMPRAAAADAR